MLRAFLLLFIVLQKFFSQVVVADENLEKITFDLIENLEIRQCILIIKEKFDFSNLNILKEFSQHNIKTSLLTKENLSGYLMGDVIVYWSTAVIIEADSLDMIQEMIESLKKEKKEHEVSKFSWLIFLNKEAEFEIEANRLIVPYNCKLIIIQQINSNSYFLKEVYNIKDVKILNLFGTWDSYLGLAAVNEPFYVRRRNLHNVTLIYAADTQKRGYCPPGGYLGCAKREVFYCMEKMLNFHIQLVKNQRGRKDDYADVYDSRSSFSNYNSIAPLFKAYLNWYIKDPEVEPHQDFYIHPFEIHLWYSVLFTIFISSLVIVIIGYINKILRRESPMSQLIDNIFTSYEIFCNQDGGQYRDYASFRIAVLTILLTALFILPSYSAVITSFLAVRIPNVPFRNLEEFVKNGKYILIRKEGAVVPELYFKQSNDQLIQKIYERFLKAYSEEEGLRKTCRGLYAMMAPNIYLKDDNAECSYYQIPKAITHYFLELRLAKYSVFRDIFRHIMPPFYSSGIVNHVQEDLDEIPIKHIDENQFFPVRLHQMAHIFLMVVFGSAFGIIILCLEIFFKYFKKCRSLFLSKKKIKIPKKKIVKSILMHRVEYDYDRRVKKQIRWQ